MTWIRTVPYDDATGRLKTLYDRVKGPGNNVDNIMMAHSLRPHSMEGHMHLYKYVLHHAANTVPKHFLETIGVQVSLLNGCSYCVEHHFQGLRRLLGDDRFEPVHLVRCVAGEVDREFFIYFGGLELPLARFGVLLGSLGVP